MMPTSKRCLPPKVPVKLIKKIKDKSLTELNFEVKVPKHLFFETSQEMKKMQLQLTLIPLTPRFPAITRKLYVGLDVDNSVVLYSNRSRYINLNSDAEFDFITSLKDLNGNYILEVKLLNIYS